MNIKQAKRQIQNALIAYRTKNAYGERMLPMHKQRPIFLIGAPGIGKTAIVEQVAREMGVALVSYSITHHTRQSALGLPFISQMTCEGKNYRISEYTMSEIIASVYKTMEETGLKEGILFLDEINCVSETLMPAMLQFLQYKVFGQHKVPEGWMIVTAGNPPEYNQSVREFDMVTQDRIKRIDVEPDYEVWKEWAGKEGVESCILSYLELRKEDFYKVENTIDGRSFVTPRGWEDLSNMIRLYRLNQLEVDENLIRQYLQDEHVTNQFSVFYQLWEKYENDYKVKEILSGNMSEELIRRAQEAPFDEKISLIGLLLDGVKEPMREIAQQRAHLAGEKRRLEDLCTKKEAEETEEIEAERKLRQENYANEMEELARKAEMTGKNLDHLFVFCEKAFGTGAEMSMVVTELTSFGDAAKFISWYGCAPYFKYNKELLFYERKKSVLEDIDELL